MVNSCSCFKIITCSGDSKSEDDVDVHENKDSRDKRGWSFRKKSSQHRVLNDTVITETPSGEKDNLETVVIDFQPPANSTVIEKSTVIHFTGEGTHVPNIDKPKGSDNIEVASQNESKVDGQVEESIVIVIQAGIRGLLARRALLKLKNVVKVQAAVRGLLVRRHAVGTLRCVQAIIKMQTLVRARRAHRAMEGSAPDELQEKRDKENPGLKILVKGELTKSNPRYTSIDKLLTNSFALQLLESGPRNKPINIKCDPSKHDSAWKWLERWMSVSSSDTSEAKQAEQDTKKIEREDESNVEDENDSVLETEDLSSNTTKSVLPSEGEDSINHDANTHHSRSSSVGDDLEHSHPETFGTSEVEETSTEVSPVPDMMMQLDAGFPTESNSPSEKLDMATEQVNSVKRLAPEQLVTEDEKFIVGSRKVSNPSYISAQEKFEQLSLAPNTIGTSSSMRQDDGVEPHIETVSSTADILQRKKEPSAADNIILSGLRIPQVDGSGCGTELSISSTLESPDGSEVQGSSDGDVNDVSKKGVQDPGSDLNMEVEVKEASTIEVEVKEVSNMEVEVKEASTMEVEVKDPMKNDFQLFVDQPEKAGNGQFITSVVSVDSAPSDAKMESVYSELHGKLDTDMGNQTSRLSPEASPRSHLTVPESQGTPSSQVSVKAQGQKTDKTGSYKKPKSLSAGKKSPSNLNRNSGTPKSAEHLHKDEKNVKRRNSFDSARPDHIEPEVQDSSSNNFLPHYMQATESARAKVQSSNSPRSSPDVQDRELYIKKRHSLPADGRQGSPRIQEPMRAQQGAKGNEKAWRR